MNIETKKAKIEKLSLLLDSIYCYLLKNSADKPTGVKEITLAKGNNFYVDYEAVDGNGEVYETALTISIENIVFDED